MGSSISSHSAPASSSSSSGSDLDSSSLSRVNDVFLTSDPGSSSSQSHKYDVFLSFRGEDIRLTFVDHLDKALVEKSIITFKDDRGLLPGQSIGQSLFTAIDQSHIAVIVFSENYADSSWCLEELPGQSIGQSLFTAIDQSHIAVIVFSENYADSSWCLEELAYIMKCKVDRGLIVMPIFYNVEPTDVRKQKGKFGEAFARLLEKKQAAINVESWRKGKFGEAFARLLGKKQAAINVESWRKALADATNIVGFHSKSRPETEFIQVIVDKILDGLPSSLCSYVDDEGFVGMTSRIKDLKLRLKIGSDGVRMVGIWGVGGGGKTTLATSVFMEISHQFEGSCIVENVRAKSSKLEKLQEMILSAVLKTEMKVYGVAEGKHKIKSMLCRRKVLVLLDDVDQLGQLEALAGSHNWFGIGSRVIITTRDEHLLKSHKVDDIYQVKLLSDDEATRLFDKHACNKKDPIKDYKRLSLHVVCYADGLPLALKVLGSFLYDKNEKEWRSALDRLKDIPEKKIVEMLKISYDGLDREEKELFLDIACFFRGWHNDSSEDHDERAREILEACGFHLDVGIKVLSQKALIYIDAKGRFEMHDLVQEMGHFIVRGEHPNNPEYHSRLWKKKDIMNLSLGDATKKNDTIEAIKFRDIASDDEISRCCKNISNMKKLRWLLVWAIDGSGKASLNFLSNELRYIKWAGFLAFPNSFQPTKLVVLKLSHSSQKVLWKGDKDLPCLKVLDLYWMKALVSTPDFKGLPSLQKLKLEFCEALEEIHPSLGNHKSLEYVRVFKCFKLRKFPIIVHMEKLHTLEIRHYRKIHELSEIQANMESVGERCTSLTSLDMDICDFKRTEFNMDASKRLNTLKANSISDTQLLLSDSDEMRFHQFLPSTLQKLELSNCSLEDGTVFLSGIGELSNLKELNLSWNKFTRLDSGLFSQLTQLIILNLQGCSSLFLNNYDQWRLQSRFLPSSLQKLNLSECSLEDGTIFLSGIGELSNLKELNLSFNEFIRLDSGLFSQLTRLKILNLKGCRKLERLPELPSSVAILNADYCDSLTAVGDSLTNCKCLCQVSFDDGGILNDGDRVLESMLQGNAIENGTMLLRLLTGLGGFKPCLREGKRCRLELPEKWRNEFSGFLIRVVIDDYPGDFSVKMAMDSQDEVVWEEEEEEEECVHDVVTLVGYISFALLKKKNIPWWDQTYNQLSFSIVCFEPDVETIYGFGVRLVGKKGESGSTDSSQLSKYAPGFRIDHVSPSSVQINFTNSDYGEEEWFINGFSR